MWSKKVERLHDRATILVMATLATCALLAGAVKFDGPEWLRIIALALWLASITAFFATLWQLRRARKREEQ